MGGTVIESAPILITGGTGFVGSHIARRMLQDGCSIHLIIRPHSNCKEWENLKNDRIHFHEHDGSTTGLIRILEKVRPRSVLHLASLFVAEHSPENVEQLIVSNILFGTQLLEAMKVAGVHRIVNTGTSWEHFETENNRPSCLYAATKQAFHDILSFYSDAYDFRAVTLKLFDTFGPCDPRRKLLFLLRKAAITGIPLLMSGGEQLIDLVYIDDVAEAFSIAEFRLLEESGARNEAFGISSGNPISLRRVVDVYQDVLGQKIPVKWGARPYRKREIMVPWNGNPGLPGWKANTDLLTGLRQMQEVSLVLNEDTSA